MSPPNLKQIFRLSLSGAKTSLLCCAIHQASQQKEKSIWHLHRSCCKNSLTSRPPSRGEGPKKKWRIKFPKLKKKPPVKRLIALALAAGAVYWMFLRPGGKGPDLQASYTAAPVTMRDIVVSVSGTGTVTPADSYKVGALVTGEILEAPFAEGDRVEKGALLYRVDPGAAQTALDQAL